MDTSDPNLRFNEAGLCEYCENFDKEIKPNWHPNERGAQKLDALAAKIKAAGKGHDFDCIIGLSGGLKRPGFSGGGFI